MNIFAQCNNGECVIGWIIRFVFMTLCLICSTLNIIIIFAERYHKLEDLIYNLTLQIQICNIVVLVDGILYYPGIPIQTCYVKGPIYYSFWYISNLLTLLILYFILKIMFREPQQKLYIKMRRLKTISYIVGIVTYFALSFFYEKCKINNMYDYFCGICSFSQYNHQISSLIILIIWYITFGLVIILGIYYFILIYQEKQRLQQLNNLTNEIKLYLQVSWIPFTTFLLLWINILLKSFKLPPSTFYLQIILNLIQYLTGPLNLLFFVLFIRKSETQGNLMYFQWILFRQNNSSKSFLIQSNEIAHEI